MEPLGPVRGGQNTEPRRSFLIAPKRSGTPSVMIGRVCKRWRSEIASSGCTALLRTGPVDTTRSDPTINTHLANRIGRLSGAVCRPSACVPATATPRRRPSSSFRSSSTLSAHLPISAGQGVTRTPRAFPEAQHGFTGLFLIIKKGRSRQGAFSALNLDYLGKPYVLGAKNCTDVLSQAAAQPHRVRTCCTLHRHVSMVLLKRCGESHVTPIRSQAARDGRRRKRHKRHLWKYPG